MFQDVNTFPFISSLLFILIFYYSRRVSQSSHFSFSPILYNSLYVFFFIYIFFLTFHHFFVILIFFLIFFPLLFFSIVSSFSSIKNDFVNWKKEQEREIKREREKKESI